MYLILSHFIFLKKYSFHPHYFKIISRIISLIIEFELDSCVHVCVCVYVFSQHFIDVIPLFSPPLLLSWGVSQYSYNCLSTYIASFSMSAFKIFFLTLYFPLNADVSWYDPLWFYPA